MLPLLQIAADGKEHSMSEAIQKLAELYKLTEEDQRTLLPSGQQRVFENRVGWARTYLKKAGLLESPQRSYFQLTERGRQVLKNKPDKINNKFLRQYEEFKEFQSKSKKSDDKEVPETTVTPEEAFESAYENLRGELAAEILQYLKSCTWALFEKIVVDVLVKMGYGGSLKDAGKAIGKTGDEGIDGIIKEDRLGLDIIYVQAKRWDSVVSSPEIQKFAGALQGQRARKGIFITTSSFSKEALEYVNKIDSKIILIDGESLAEYMIDFNVGVTTASQYEIKKIDIDYFSGD